MGGISNFQHMAENIRVELEINKGKVGHVGLRCQHMCSRLGSFLRTINIPALEEIASDAEKMALTSHETQASLGNAVTHITSVISGVDNEHAQNVIGFTREVYSNYEGTLGPNIAEVSDSIRGALDQIITGIKQIETLHSRLPLLGAGVAEISGLEIRNTLGISASYSPDTQGLLPQALDALSALRNST